MTSEGGFYLLQTADGWLWDHGLEQGCDE